MYNYEEVYYELLNEVDRLNAQVLAITKAQEAAAKEAADKLER